MITGGKPQDGPKRYKIVGIMEIGANDEAGAADILKNTISQMPWYKFLRLEEIKDQ